MATQNYQPKVDLAAVEQVPQERWRFGVLLALAVLGAVVLVIAYSHWFGDLPSTASNEAGGSKSEASAEKPGRASHSISRHTISKRSTQAGGSAAPDAQLTLAPGVTQSSLRSPLAVEVTYGGNRHQIIGTRNDSIYLPSASPDVISTVPSSSAGVMDNGASKQQTMEGSVVLLARIDKEGRIVSLQPTSGPEVLFAAAREAVKQLRFTPYYTSGQPVETETQITVKFAISAH